MSWLAKKVPMMNSISAEARRMQSEVDEELNKRKILKNLDCFVLDNSLRETSIGQLRGHTMENKYKIYDEVKKCGFKHMIIASFGHSPRVDDAFCVKIRDSGEDMRLMYAFSELAGKQHAIDGALDTSVPSELLKLEKYGIRNCIFECDVQDDAVDWEKKFTVHDFCNLLAERFDWCREHLASDGNIFVNFRDLPFAMTSCPERLLTVIDFISRLPKEKRIFGIVFEEPTGTYLPEEMGKWTASVRRVMTKAGWADGHLLVHVHQKWGFSQYTQLECLVNGADGFWGGVCEEGSAMGHACSSVTLLNLIRMGNTKILDKFNCTYLRKAAIEVTKITTGGPPHPKQVVYGDRALDLVFDFGKCVGGTVGPNQFNLADFFGERAPMRMTTLSTPRMVLERLVNFFGNDPQYTTEIATKMKTLVIEDLTNNRKEEYMSKTGLAILFDRAGGKITEKMRDVITAEKNHAPKAKMLLKEVREMWDQWDLRDEDKGDECLQFDSFYDGFMIPYFGCYRCDITRKAFQAIDMDSDGLVDWKEFLVYLTWALREYPEIDNVDDLLSFTFRKGIIPAMRDESIKKLTDEKKCQA